MIIREFAGFDRPEVTVALKSMGVGDTFRFASDTFEEALENNKFYMVIPSTPALTEDRVEILSLDGKERLKRDGIHRVVRHQVHVEVTRNEDTK